MRVGIVCAPHAREHGADEQRVAGEPEVCQARAEGEDGVARALRDGVLATLASAGVPLHAAAVALCDHGSPVPAVGVVRGHLAAQLRALLPAPPRAFSEASMEKREGPAFAFNDPLLEVLLRAPPFDDGVVVVALAFLSPGKHAGPGGDLVGIAEAAERDAARAGRALRVLFTPLLGASEAVAEVLRDRLLAALDGGSGA